MAGKFPNRGDFSIPSSLLDEHEWVSDNLIDGETGVDVTLVYPSSDIECINCLLDPITRLSSGKYKAGGPSPFPDFSTCPVCGGSGKGELEKTDSVRLRVYTDPRKFVSVGNRLVIADGYAEAIGYANDLAKVLRCREFVLPDGSVYERQSEPTAWGFRKNRYFVMLLKRRGN